jgi:hypothetical protein
MVLKADLPGADRPGKRVLYRITCELCLAQLGPLTVIGCQLQPSAVQT